MNVYEWTELSQIPAMPGVYAWYYKPELTSYDIENVIKIIRKHKKEGDLTSAHSSIKLFLEEYIFKYFIEDPYKVILRGPLKPKYEGQIEHIPTISDSLIDRIIKSPDKLKIIKMVLENSAPQFASPIYIGMSEDLRRRLNGHKKLIESFNKQKLKFSGRSDTITDKDENKNIRDKNFAFQICKRNIVPSHLFVMIKVITDSENSYIDIENILNRIHHPLFGRN